MKYKITLYEKHFLKKILNIFSQNAETKAFFRETLIYFENR